MNGSIHSSSRFSPGASPRSSSTMPATPAFADDGDSAAWKKPPVRDDNVLRVRAATFFRRTLAALVDVTLVSGFALGLAFAAAWVLGVPLPPARELGPDLLIAGLVDRNPVTMGTVGLWLGAHALYQIYFAGMAGQTLGMRLFGLRIISVRGTVPGALRGIGRLLAMAVAVAPAGLGWLWFAVDRERRALHDHLAGTYVIVDP